MRRMWTAVCGDWPAPVSLSYQIADPTPPQNEQDVKVELRVCMGHARIEIKKQHIPRICDPKTRKHITLY